ncbi:MAG: hypothetical protein KKF95_06460, partial [Nanoarchaeota archaeon]|nr:hypothetical protein [Nanoarchaeota archaeon]
MKLKDYNNYGIIIIVFILIFLSNMFKNLLIVDYISKGFVSKSFLTTNFSYVSIFQPLQLLSNIFHLQTVFFQLVVLIAMLFSFYFIKKLFPKYSLFFAFIFFFNPFMYSRLMVGQIGVILTYLLLPVFIYYILDKHKNSLYKAIFVATIIGSVQSQYFIICFGIFFLSLIFYKHNRTTKSIALFAILLIALNMFWLQGMFANNIFSSIDSSHESFFSPVLRGDSFSTAKIIGMWGFWREAGYITTFNTFPHWLWFLMVLSLVALMLVGFFSRKKDKTSKFFFSLWWIGVFFASGYGHPYTRPIFDFLFNNLPFFNGFRDSHKFVVLIVLAYAYLVPIGLIKVRDWLKTKTPFKKLIHYAVPILFVIFILAYTYPLIGLWGQVNSTDYPKSYEQTNQFLLSQNMTGQILYLPWENYLTYNWTVKANPDGRIAVPINNIVKPIIITGSGQWGSANNLQLNITNCLNNQSLICLANNNVELVLKDKCAFYPNE